MAWYKYAVLYRSNHTRRSWCSCRHCIGNPTGTTLVHRATGHIVVNENALNIGEPAGLFGLQGFSEQSQNQYLQSRLFYQTIKVFFG